MKRILSIFAAFICIFVLFGCSYVEFSDLGGRTYFEAKVVEEYEQSVRLEVYAGECGLRSGDLVSMSKQRFAKFGIEEVKIGDRYQVVFDGEIMETYPVQIGKVYEIQPGK